MTYLNNFASLFELAVALSFAYVASDSIRDLFKKGFLATTRQLSSIIDLKIISINSKLVVLNDSILHVEKKEKVKGKLKSILLYFKNFDEKLDARIEEAQILAQNKLKSLYIISAFYAMMVLFLGGVESINSSIALSSNNTFPYTELATMSLLVLIIFLIITFYSFKEKYPPVFAMTILMLVVIIITIFIPFMGYFDTKIPEKALTYLSVFISFMPFIIVTIRLLVATLLIELEGWVMYLIHSFRLWIIQRKINKIEKAMDTIF